LQAFFFSKLEFDNFLGSFVFGGTHGGLVLSADYTVLQLIVAFVLIPVFIWQFQKIKTPWLLKVKD